MGIATNMRFHGEKMEDVVIVEKILRSLTEKFNFVVCSIKESKDIDSLSLDELHNSLLIHEQKINRNRNTTIEEQALKVTSSTNFSNARGRGRGRGYRGNGDGGRHNLFVHD
ncbi:uncharacterized protein LOC107262421 [Ricinus communis]|uniref:uncharacterized protein LOC107262421 n=1 Tax=Ricinus communis TaxID=3988 RepID=UPI00201A3964|nr:uncharacterized protein LOC107262421 [Ricinus communis]